MNVLFLIIIVFAVAYSAYKIRNFIYCNSNILNYCALTDIAIISTAILVVTQNILLVTGAYTLNIATACLLFLAVISGVLLKSPVCKIDFKLNNFVPDILSKLIATALACILFTTLIIALNTPTVAWDSLLYHFLFPSLWVQNHGFADKLLPAPLESYSHFPFNGEIFSSWLLLIFHGGNVVSIGNFFAFSTLLVGLYSLAREVKLSVQYSVLFSLLISFTGMPFSQIRSGYVDLPVLAWMICTLLYGIRYFRYKDFSSLVFLLLSYSLALGAKLTAAPFSIFILILLFKNRPNFNLKTSIAFIASSFIGGFWYIKNLIETKNPIYPFGVSILGQNIFEPSGYKKAVMKALSGGDPKNDFLALISVFDLISWPTSTSMGPIYLILIFIALLFFYRQTPAIERSIQIILVIFSTATFLNVFFSLSPELTSSRRYWPEFASRFVSFQVTVLALIAIVQIYNSKFQKLGLIILNIGVLCNCLVIIYTTSSTFTFYSNKSDYLKFDPTSKTLWPNGLADALSFVERQEAMNIAYYPGSSHFGHNWFIAPFMGSRLQNQVNFVPIPHDENISDPEVIVDVWKKRFNFFKTDTLIFQFPWIHEIDIIKNHPQDFKLAFKDSQIQIYHINN